MAEGGHNKPTIAQLSGERLLLECALEALVLAASARALIRLGLLVALVIGDDRAVSFGID